MKYHIKLDQRNPKREELVKKTSAMKDQGMWQNNIMIQGIEVTYLLISFEYSCTSN